MVAETPFVTLVKELVAQNVLILCTGCAAGSFARHGLLTPAALKRYRRVAIVAL